MTSEEEEEEEMGEVLNIYMSTIALGVHSISSWVCLDACLQVDRNGPCPCVFAPDAPGQQDIEDLDHYEMKEEEPVDGKKSEDDGIEKENLAILEKIRKNQRQDHLNVSAHSVGAPFFI